ncbi:MAG: hypothetical protein WDZ35_03305 [Crocinitomicaceae bacterium]
MTAHAETVAETVEPAKKEVAQSTVSQKKEQVAETSGADHYREEARKKVSQPSGKLSTTNIGIKATLNPPEEKKRDAEASILEEQNEEYTVEQLQRCWKEYALGVKRERKNSLFATLMKCDLHVDSNHLITLKIKNSIQRTELDEEKGSLVRFLRVKLKNSHINLEYEIDETEKTFVLDSKSKFNKLAEENASLHKLQKLFNLDIEF